MRIQAKTRDVALTYYHTAVSHPSFLHLFEPKLTDKLEMSSEPAEKIAEHLFIKSGYLNCIRSLLRAAAASFPLCNYFT